jgi:hypothetical protein
MVREELAHATTAKTRARILWFISAFPLSIPHDILAVYVTPLLNYEDSYVRSLVLKIIYGAKESTSIETVIQRGWRWSKSNAENENHWGSLILCENGTRISFDELLGRIDPAYLGYAVIRRGNRTHEVEIYAEAIHQVLSGLTTTTPALQPDLPHFTVDSSVAADMQQVSLRGLFKDTYSRTITFRSPHATWGGTIGRELNLGEWTSIDFMERRKRLLQILRETVEQQKAAGNIWFGRVVRPTELEKIVAQRPDLVGQWVKAALSNAPDAMSLLEHGSSFYAALCAVLLRTDVQTAVALYWRIQEAGTRVHVIDENTGIELLDFALFSASPSEALRETWRRKLEQCDTDLELMKLAFLSQHGTGKDWLWSYIRARTNSAVPIDRARSITLLGFLDSQEAREALQQLDWSLPDTWLRHLVKRSITRSKRNNWAKHWFRLFLANGDNVKAWASFRLFLRCIDGRFWLWRRVVETDIGDSNAIKERMAFLRDNLENVHDCIRDNEKELSEQFLGQKVLKREAWPWLLAS